MAGMERCRQLASPNMLNFVVSCIILLGLLLSYLPQHYRIIRRRSTEGLSPWWVLLGTTSGTCAIGNILMLPTSHQDMACCSVNDGFSCAAGLLGIVQIGVQWSCFFLIMFLYLVFTERHPVESTDVGQQFPLSAAPALFDAVIVTSVSVLHFVVVLLISIVILARFPGNLQGWANFLGIGAAILASIQYLPQIWLTWKLGHVGSLSIPMMLIQTPGGFVFAGSLAARLGPGGWSAWSVYLVLGTLQGVVLVMGICFAIRDRKNAKEIKQQEARDIQARNDGQFEDRPEDGWQHGRSFVNESTPLLAGGSHDGNPGTTVGRRRQSSVEEILDPARLIVESRSPSPDPRKGACNVA